MMVSDRRPPLKDAEVKENLAAVSVAGGAGNAIRRRRLNPINQSDWSPRHTQDDGGALHKCTANKWQGIHLTDP